MLSLLTKNQISLESSLVMLSGIIYSGYHKEKSSSQEKKQKFRLLLENFAVLLFHSFFTAKGNYYCLKLLFYPRIACLYKFEIYVVII